MVKAVDDFMVMRVKVAILNAAGAVIEQGDAGPDAEKINLWVYHATVANACGTPVPDRVKKIATDYTD